MKAGREHRVPLSESALAILEKFGEARVSEFHIPWPGGREAALGDGLRRMLAPGSPML